MRQTLSFVILRLDTHVRQRITEYVILSEAAVALCQSQMNLLALCQSQMNLLLERCCMGVVYQIEDLDNSSKDLKMPTMYIIFNLSGLTDQKKVFNRSLDKLGMTAFSYFIQTTAASFYTRRRFSLNIVILFCLSYRIRYGYL